MWLALALLLLGVALRLVSWEWEPQLDTYFPWIGFLLASPTDSAAFWRNALYVEGSGLRSSPVVSYLHAVLRMAEQLMLTKELWVAFDCITVLCLLTIQQRYKHLACNGGWQRFAPLIGFWLNPIVVLRTKRLSLSAFENMLEAILCLTCLEATLIPKAGSAGKWAFTRPAAILSAVGATVAYFDPMHLAQLPPVAILVAGCVGIRRDRMTDLCVAIGILSLLGGLLWLLIDNEVLIAHGAQLLLVDDAPPSLSVPLSPSLGVQWYMMQQMFDGYSTLYTAVIRAFPFAMGGGLCLSLVRKIPSDVTSLAGFFLALGSVLVGLCKPFTTLPTVCFSWILVVIMTGSWWRGWEKAVFLLVEMNAMMIPLTCVLYSAWLKVQVANPNFMFFSTLASSAASVTLIVVLLRLVVAHHVRSEPH